MVAPQPFFRPRGTPFSVLHRIRALVEAGHEVDLVTYPFGEDVAMPRLRILRAGRVPLVRDVRIGPSFGKALLDGPLYVRTVRALRDRSYDVLHTHEEAAFFGVGLAQRHGLLHVYDMHSSLPDQLENFGKFNFGPFQAMFRGLERRTLQSADGVITICQELADIAASEIGDTPHAMIENIADDAKAFPPGSEDVVSDFGLQGRRIVLYTGTFESYQGLDLLIEAFARLRGEESNVQLVMVGGQSSQVAAEAARARSLGIAEHVTFVGSVHPSRIPGFMGIADVIVSPRSTGTNTPLKIYNYLRSGRPLVATDMWTHTQTLSSDTAELVPPTPEGFARGMLRVLRDTERARTLGAAGAKFAEEHFSDAAYLRRVREFYDAVLDHAGAQAR